MAWYHRLLNTVRGDALSRDLDREMQFHITERADELVRAGMPADQAVREARRRFGMVQQQKERTRDADVLVWLESLVTDARYAVRALARSPGFAFVAIVSIGLGVGANTAIFSLVNAVMLRPLPVPRAGELLKMTDGDGGSEFTNPLWEEVRDHQDAVDAFAYGGESFNLANGGESRRVEGNWVSGSYFPVLGTQPLAGRLLSRADDVRGCAALAVVSPGFAAREYGTPEAAVGRTVSLTGHPFQIIGVTEPAFSGVDVGSRPQVYAPICALAIVNGNADRLDSRSSWWLQLMARPRSGYALAQVNARLGGATAAIHAATLPAQWPAEHQAEYLKRVLSVVPAATGSSDVRDKYRGALLALMGVVAVVLLIACANVAHLLLARAATREREMALRLALGVGRARLVRQLLTESVLLALAGAAAGPLFAQWANTLIVEMLAGRNNTVWLDLRLDLRVLGFTVAVATLTGILFGLVPAWRATRLAPQAALQTQGRAVAGRGRFSVMRGLVVGQVALSLTLMVAAGLLLRSFQKLATLDPGFQPQGVLLVDLSIEGARYPDEQRLTVFRDLLTRMRAVPGVTSASGSLLTPISGQGWNGDVEADGFVPKTRRDGIVWFNGVSDRFFATMGTRRIAGRDFTDADVAHGTPVAIINASMAKKLFGTANPIGRQFRSRQGRTLGAPIEVVGVVQDAKYRSLKDAETSTAYLPLSQSELWGGNLSYALRTDGDTRALVPSVRKLSADVNPAISLDFLTLSEQVSASLARPRLLATLSAFFGALALILATVGLYGTIAYSVARRQGEIGIRMALGAARTRVVRMVLGEVAWLLAAGTAFGIGIAFATTRLLSTFLYGLTATDPATMVLSVAALAVVAAAAGAVPAWRAAHLDPMAALREE